MGPMTQTHTPTMMVSTAVRLCLNPYASDEADERIVQFLKPSVLHVVQRWLANPTIRRLYEKDDMVQECYLTIFRKVLGNFQIPDKDEEDIEKLLCRYVINSLNNHWRDALRTANRRLHPVEESVLFGSRLRSSKDVDGLDLFGQEDTLHDTHERDMLGKIQGAVSKRDFQIAYLRYQGHSPNEIGDMLGITGKSVRVRLRGVIGPALSDAS